MVIRKHYLYDGYCFKCVSNSLFNVFLCCRCTINSIFTSPYENQSVGVWFGGKQGFNFIRLNLFLLPGFFLMFTFPSFFNCIKSVTVETGIFLPLWWDWWDWSQFLNVQPTVFQRTVLHLILFPVVLILNIRKEINIEMHK